MQQNQRLANTSQHFELSELSELLIQNSSEGIILVDSHLNIKLFNRKAEHNFDYSSEEVIGKNISIIIPDCFIKEYINNDNIVLMNTKKNTPLEIYSKKKNGQPIILEAFISQFNYRGERLYTITFTNITERKIYEDLLHRLNRSLEEQVNKKDTELSKTAYFLKEEISRRKQKEIEVDNLFTAVEQTEESIIILNKKGIITYTNPTFTTITGFTIKEIYQKRAKLLVGPTSLIEYKKIIKTLIESNKWHGIYEARKKDGSCYEEEATIISIKNGSNEIISYVAVCRDISEKKRVESLITNVDMMKNVGYIFAGIRHELGNPINSIKTSLSVLKKGLDTYSQETVAVYIERALSEISRVEYLLKNLKTFSMYENLKSEKVNLVTFMERFCALAREDAKKQGINLDLTYNTSDIPVFIDQRAFHQVMLNIFSNSVDALQARLNPVINISLITKGKYIKIEISDNGIGLTESQKEKLFKPFHTFKTQGNGLGLVITKKLITNMHGLIELESEYQVGTKVSILLEMVG